MSGFFKDQCRSCKQASAELCESVFREILTPFPSKDELLPLDLDLCLACNQVIEYKYSYCFVCSQRGNRGLGLLSGLDFIGFHSPPSPFNYVKRSWKDFGRVDYFRPIGALFARWIAEHNPQVDLITHVPSFSKIDGYDPLAYVLALANDWTGKQLSRTYELHTGIFEKTGDREFKTMSASERMEADAYVAADDTGVEGKRILLIDDVYTTGESLQQVARIAIDEMGAIEVRAFVLARTIDKKYRDRFQAQPRDRCPHFST